MVGSLTSQLEHNLGEIATTQTQYMQSLQRSLDNLSAKARSTSSEANQVAQSRVAVLNEGTDACVEDLNKLQTAHSKAESFAKSFYSNLQSTFLGEIDRLQEERRVVDQTVKEMSIEMLDNVCHSLMQWIYKRADYETTAPQGRKGCPRCAPSRWLWKRPLGF